jgi:hypothetical protein
MVTDVRPRTGPTATDVVRFVLVAVLAFGLFFVAGWFFFNRRTSPPAADPEQAEEAATTPEPNGASSAESSGAVEAPEKSRRKKARKGRSGPIDVFGDDVADRPADQKIVIEGGQ